MSIFPYKTPLLAPSLLASSKDLLGGAKRAALEGFPFLHFDVMDGKFVTNVSFTHDDFLLLRKSLPESFLDVHLMVQGPLSEGLFYAHNGADLVTFHYEALNSEKERISLIDALHMEGIKVGMSIKPHTPTDVLLPYLGKLDLVLLMSVEPGKGGQAFLPESLRRMEKLVELRKEAKREDALLLEIDGGIDDRSGPKAIASGADILVSGSYLFKAPSMKEAGGRIL